MHGLNVLPLPVGLRRHQCGARGSNSPGPACRAGAITRSRAPRRFRRKESNPRSAGQSRVSCRWTTPDRRRCGRSRTVAIRLMGPVLLRGTQRLRRRDLHTRPLGYEPSELLLLHSAIGGDKGREDTCLAAPIESRVSPRRHALRAAFGRARGPHCTSLRSVQFGSNPAMC